MSAGSSTAEEERKKKIKKVAVGVGIGVGVAAGAAVAVVAAPLVIAGAGFGASGVVSGSMAAAAQSMIGNVAAGSVFASLQSAGVLGLAAGTTAAVGAAGGAVGGAAAGAVTNAVVNAAFAGENNEIVTTVESHSQTGDLGDFRIEGDDDDDIDVDVWPRENKITFDRATQTGGRIVNYH